MSGYSSFRLVAALLLGLPLWLIFLPPIASTQTVEGKLGQIRNLPNLQTRAKPPLLPETLHMGMMEYRFFQYAKNNNWAAIATLQHPHATAHQLQPGGEGLYALPDLELIYARGFTAEVYFEQGRLVGMRLTSDPRDASLTATELLTLVRAWFPDEVLSVLYQVIPSDPKQRIVEGLIGKIPEEFKQDLGRTKLPFCRVVVFPAPIPLSASLSTCAQTS